MIHPPVLKCTIFSWILRLFTRTSRKNMKWRSSRNMKWRILLLVLLTSEFLIEVNSAPSKHTTQNVTKLKKDANDTANKEFKAVEKKVGKTSGRRKATERLLVRGSTVSETKWSWQVAVSTLQDGQYKFKCGGSLISNTVVMTAAHCLRIPDITSNMVIVTVGDKDRAVDEGTEQTRNVAEIAIHPSYIGTLSSLYGNDIALLKLSQAVTSTDSVSSIPLAAQNTTIGDNVTCLITGWGISNTRSVSTGITTKLSRADMGILSNVECNQRKNWDGLIKPLQLCAYNKRISACLGDSGGPLVCNVNNKFIQYGVTSWGSKSCDRKPAVFARVTFYFAWIHETIARFNSESNNS